MLTQEESKKIFRYDEETGLFERLDKPWLKITHRVDDSGHVNITINRVRYKAHRLAWLYVYGVMPAKFIDHINGIANDNRIANLREVSNTQNLQNQKLRKTNTSGYKGVSWIKAKGKWVAQICANYVSTTIGFFDTPFVIRKALALLVISTVDRVNLFTGFVGVDINGHGVLSARSGGRVLKMQNCILGL